MSVEDILKETILYQSIEIVKLANQVRELKEELKTSKEQTESWRWSANNQESLVRELREKYEGEEVS